MNLAVQVKLYSAQPGEMVGMLAVLTGEPSFFTTRTKSDVILAVITKTDFYRLAWNAALLDPRYFSFSLLKAELSLSGSKEYIPSGRGKRGHLLGQG